MIDLNTYLEMHSMYEHMGEQIRLHDVAELTSGYYPMHSKIYSLKDCPYRGGCVVEGFSEILKQYVSVEKAALRPIISPSAVKRFSYADYQHYSSCLIVADTTSFSFNRQYPLTAEYLYRCFRSENMDPLEIEKGLVLRPKLREEIDKKKVIISTAKNECRAMLDAETHVISTLNTYFCSFPREDFQTYKAYTAILNSKLFNYVFYREMQVAEKLQKTRIEVLLGMPIPKNMQAGKEMLISITDCMSYLSNPDISQLSDRVSKERIGQYILKILDLIVYELYFPEYVREHDFRVIRYVEEHAPFMDYRLHIEDRIRETYKWFQQPDNVVRQVLWLLDTRSPELLYPIHSFNPHEQD